MKITRATCRRNKGFVLLMTMVFVGIALLLLGSVMEWSSSSVRQTERNNLFNKSTAAADAATERVMAQMWRDYYNQAFNSASSYTGFLPNQSGWPVQFNFSNGSGVANQTGVSISPTDWTENWVTLNAFNSQYTGLAAYVAQCTVTSTAMARNQLYNVSATVQQKFQLASIPIFQFSVFYNLNMEIDPGATMTLTGPVFSNGGIWARGLGTFNSAVSAVGTVSTNGTDPYLTSKSDGNQPTFDSTVTSNADTMSMPVGQTNDPGVIRSLLNLPPSGTDPYSVTGQEYFINKANLVISNSSGGTISAYFQDPNNATPLTPIPYDAVALTTITTTNGYTTNYTEQVTKHWSWSGTYYTTNYTEQITPITSSYTTNIPYYSFATNVAFYDHREKKTVQAVQLNIGALNAWLNNTNGSVFNDEMNRDSGHYIDSVYVYNNSPDTSTSLASVRVANGATLPSVNGVSDGLTVVTPDPLYVLGNYNASGQSLNNHTNVVDTAPAALIGDAITVLSSNWKDNVTTTLPAAAPTTVNAATFEGIVPSNGNNYSGGVENFLRLLENWGGVTLTYNGSIVVMFPSQYATNNWSYGTYYKAPKRDWSFDLNFTRQSGLPPLTPEVCAFVRQSWTVK